jgi:hypothetical protein
VLEGQLIAISSLDEVIAICRSSPSRSEAKDRLKNLEVAAAVMKRALGDEPFAALQSELGTLDVYRMTEAQAEAVVNLRLGQLAALERDEIFKEYNTLREQIRGDFPALVSGGQPQQSPRACQSATNWSATSARSVARSPRRSTCGSGRIARRARLGAARRPASRGGRFPQPTKVSASPKVGQRPVDSSHSRKKELQKSLRNADSPAYGGTAR